MYKFLVFSFFSLMVSIVSAQETPFAELTYGDALQVDNIEVEFVKVISDSRCPKNVQCIRAGEAKVLVDIFKDGTFLKQQELIFYAASSIDLKQNTLISNNDIQLTGVRLMPYPTSAGKIPLNQYFLELKIN